MVLSTSFDTQLCQLPRTGHCLCSDASVALRGFSRLVREAALSAAGAHRGTDRPFAPRGPPFGGGDIEGAPLLAVID